MTVFKSLDKNGFSLSRGKVITHAGSKIQEGTPDHAEAMKYVGKALEIDGAPKKAPAPPPPPPPPPPPAPEPVVAPEPPPAPEPVVAPEPELELEEKEEPKKSGKSGFKKGN